MMQSIFEAIKDCAKAIDIAIKNEDLGFAKSSNASGEDQLKLDVKSDRIVEERFKEVDVIKNLISEEKEDILELHPQGIYTLCYDPLDGSSLADVNLSVGSIFGIYKGTPEGKNLIASAYVVYGPRVEIGFVTQEDVRPALFRLSEGKFKKISSIELKTKGKLCAPGGTQQHWSSIHKGFIDSLFANGYRLRYSGGMVPDLHQILLKGGGLFSYPGTTDKPQGKLRQLFEVLPFALIYEKAGGEAINDKGERLLALKPKHIHDTTPCFFGSKSEIEALKSAYGV
ncbi:MAG: class 1 fructose-bisphosphatase [Campylobacterales bacterium]|nr:class 1 fructose-bisphosphatase [Campylobacterales bacterium]